MLRLARLRPLATSVSGWRKFPRFYSSTEPVPSPSATDDTLDTILKDIQTASNQTPRNTLNQQLSTDTTNTSLSEASQLDALSFTEFSDKTFGDAKYTTRSYDRFLEVYPALKHEVDTFKLHAKLKYEQIYLKDHAHEPKTVFKFKKVVTKNYRTIARSWPLARLDNFKYGHDHFVDEMYDDIEGKYTWNNQLAYPDGSINLFCGTSSKASPINVKGDPLALTYDDSLHNSHTIKPVRVQIPKKEAEARFPHWVESEKLAQRKKSESEAISEEHASPARNPVLELETEAQEDVRVAAEKKEHARQEGIRRKELQEKIRARKNKIVEEYIEETIPERRARWRWETMEDERRPWRTLANRGVHKSWDDRVLYDPVTMVRLVSFSARGRMIERYYYRDELTPENTYIGSSRSDPELDPDFDHNLGILGYREKNDWQLDTSAVPDPETEEIYIPKDPNAYETARHKVVTELLPKREKKAGGEGKVEYKTKELRKDLLDEGVLPDGIRDYMVSTFKELVAEGTLKQEDQWTYYNDYVRLTAKAMSRARTEEYRKNRMHNEPEVELPGMYHVKPTFYFKYIKVNLKEGWIRFYVGEHNRAEKQFETEMASDFALDPEGFNTAMKYPFAWRYSEYKLSPEDVAAMKEVKWPPSLIPPPTSPLQVGDGSPQAQLAHYFEKTYLQFGHDIRFNPNECFDPEYDKLEDPNMKYLRSVGASASDVQFVPDPGQLDLSSRTDLTPEERAREDLRLRGVIRRAASESMERETESMVSAYANNLVIDEYYAKKTAEEIPEVTNGHSQLWINDEIPTDPDLVPHYNIREPAIRFRQKADTVYAYDSTSQKIIQEYQGYRLRVTPSKIRIVRLPNYNNAKVIFYNEKGGIERTEFHPYPNIDFNAALLGPRDRVGRSAWAFTSDAYAEIAPAHGLPSKRAQEIQKAEQHRAEALSEALRELEGADAWGGEDEKEADEEVLGILSETKEETE